MMAICGILGDAAQGLDAMSAALADYGADAATWTEGAVRLAIRTAWTKEDRAASRLHFAHDAGLVLAADARLDDRDTLCNALGVLPPERAGLGDGELILRAYLRWGRDCPRHLLGDYAFAVWDARQRMLFCVRDHIGARPFYYALQEERFIFASTVEAVLAAPGVSDALDEVTVATHLASRVFSETRTFYAAVRKLPPGQTLTVEAKATRNGSDRYRTRIERYWHPEQAPAARPASDDAYAEQFLHLYTQAVRDRLRGGPVGVHLSGGLDSSSIAVLAARELRRQNRPPPRAFTWLPDPGNRPPPAHAPEYALVDAVCAQEGLQACHGAPAAKDVLDVLRLDGTLPGVHVHMNEAIVQRHAAAQGVQVLLSGWGGDECVSFHGRGHWQHLLLSGRWRRLAAEYRDQDASAGHRVSVSTAGPPAPGVRPGAAVRTVPARTLGPLAVSPRIARGAAVRRLPEPAQDRPGSGSAPDRSLRCNVSHDPAEARRPPPVARRFRRYATSGGVPGRGPVPGEADPRPDDESGAVAGLPSVTAGEAG